MPGLWSGAWTGDGCVECLRAPSVSFPARLSGRSATQTTYTSSEDPANVRAENERFRVENAGLKTELATAYGQQRCTMRR